jgi:hypothetical protein
VKPSLLFTLCAAALAPSAQCALAGKILVVSDHFPKSSERFHAALTGGIAALGLPAEKITASTLAARLSAEQGPGAILVLPNACYFASDAKPALEAFLKRGNHLLAISGPALQNLVVWENGKWLTRDLAKVELGYAKGESIIDWRTQDLKTWQRTSGTMTNPTEFRVEPSGDSDVPDALHVKIGRLDNWDTIVSPKLTKPFPDGSDVLVLWAKGGPNTPEMVVEMREKDGSRWMGNIKLTTDWIRYVLTPTDFAYWQDNPSRGRGGPGDRFNPANAEIISFGLASGITNQATGIPHEFWVAGVRAVKDKYASVDFTPPILESISPAYKTYRTSASRVDVVGSPMSVQLNGDFVAPISRAPGFGSDALRDQRYIPVLKARDADGTLRSSAAHLFLNTTGTYSGSVWGFIGFEQDYLDRTSDQTVPLVLEMLKRMNRGLFLSNAGTDAFAYALGDTTKLGAYVSNLGTKPVSAEVEFSIRSGDKVVHTAKCQAQVERTRTGEPRLLSADPVKLEAGEYVVEVVLRVDGAAVDRIEHEFRVICFRDPAEDEIVRVRDGEFYLGGEKWHALGMNYWPTYTCGQERWLAWLKPEQYNPEIVERDLSLAEKLGINTLSIQYTDADQASPLMDFLARAHNHKIKVHAYIPGLHPLNQDPRLSSKLINAAHLAQSPAFFAYDVGWEVNVGRYDRRKEYDKDWQQWVIDRYGSVEHAVKDWGFTPDRNGEFITGPTDEQLTRDGAWNVFVSAYRRFWDDEISKRYREVREHIRTLDRNHLVGARSGYGGTGSMWAAQFFPFDLASGAKHLDFTSPEGYALGGDRLGFLKGGLITLYGRHVSGGKPVFWAEYGMSIWPQCDAAAMERQRDYFRKTLDMVRISGANGSAGWWWPGGFRIGENSDFGVVNPDGTPRPAALEISRFASERASQHAAPGPVLTMDRDKHASGLAGVYEALADEYVKAANDGKAPTLRTEATDTTSANVPLVAVGNTPCNGHNPPKHLNSEFNYIRINDLEVANGGIVESERGKPVYVEASVGNLAEAKWLAPKNAVTGAVYLVAESPKHGKLTCPIKADTPFLADAEVTKRRLLEKLDSEVTFTFRMLAQDRAEFGEVVRVTLRPR